MRVLHVYSGNLYGGVESMLATLASCRALCPAMEPHFALCFEGRLSDELRASGAPVHMIGNARVSRPATIWQARRRLKRLVDGNRFDLAVCHSCWSQAIFGPVLRAARAPVVFWLHDAVDGRHWLERWASKTPPAVVIATRRYTAATLPRLYPKAQSTLLHCPVAAPAASLSESDKRALRDDLGTPPGATVILQASRMQEWKGHALHLRALSLLKDVPGWVCWQAGGGQRPEEIRYLEELKKLVAQTGIADRVRFLGQRQDVARLMAAADIYCQPNTSPEPFGIAFIEALANGLSVVTTSMGGAREIIDNDSGILVPPDDPQALSESLRRLIKERSLRVEFAEAGRKRARELCDPLTQLRRLYDLFAHIAGREAAA